MYLISIVIKVTQKESFHTAETILDASFPGSFSCGREICLHGWSS
jgi:hypothetical protein